MKGIVESSSGDTLSLRLPSARTVTVNLSAMTLPARTLMLPGREVAVWGDWDGSALVARGVAVDYKG